MSLTEKPWEQYPTQPMYSPSELETSSTEETDEMTTDESEEPMCRTCGRPPIPFTRDVTEHASVYFDPAFGRCGPCRFHKWLVEAKIAAWDPDNTPSK